MTATSYIDLFTVQYVYEIRLDDVIYKSKVNTQPQTFSDMNLYLTSPFVGLSFVGKIETVITV